MVETAPQTLIKPLKTDLKFIDTWEESSAINFQIAFCVIEIVVFKWETEFDCEEIQL